MGLNREAYLAQLQALLPPGDAWSRMPAATLTKLLASMADELARLDGRTHALIDETDVRTVVEMLIDWERVTGLPSKCVEIKGAQSLEQRRSALIGTLAGTGGQSKAYFIGLAAALGYSVSISEFSPFRCGIGRCSQPLGGEEWQFAWAVNAAATTVIPFSAGRSSCGEPLAAWGNARLQCEIERRKPAHSAVIFRYDAPAIMDSGGDIFILDSGTL